MFGQLQIPVEETDTKRRMLTFVCIDGIVVLDSDMDQERKTKRHKWRDKSGWWRLSCPKRCFRRDRQPIPQYAADEAVNAFRLKIHYKHNLRD